MRTAGYRFLTPLTILFLTFLPAGIPGTALSGPEPGKDGAAGEETRTDPAQTRPAQTRPTQTRPADAKKRPSGKSTGEKPLSFTDEDLKKYHSGQSGPSTRPAAAPPGSEDPLKTLQDRQERSRWRQERIVRLQQRILELEGRLKTLEQKRLSIANPFVPRPQEGEGEKGEETGLSGPELIEKTDAEIRQTSQDLESARKELSTFLEANPE